MSYAYDRWTVSTEPTSTGDNGRTVTFYNPATASAVSGSTT